MRIATALVALAVSSGVLATSEKSAHAQEIVLTGPLKGAPPVIKLRLYRAGRLEIAPQVAFTLLDEYEHSYFLGGRINYYFTDWLAVGIWGGAFLNSPTDLTSQIDSVAPRSNLTSTNVAPCVPNGASAVSAANCPASGSPTFASQVSTMTFAVMPQLTAVPFRGKLALFQALFVDTEAYLFAGFGVVGINERANCGEPGTTEPACTDVKSFALASQIKPVPTFGIGLTFFINDLINVGFEYRALPFSWNRGGFDSRGLGPNGNFPDGIVNGNDETFKFNQVIGISVGFMLGGRKISE